MMVGIRNKVLLVSSMFALLSVLYSKYWKDFRTTVEDLKFEYDYIIVGSGSAGAIVAARLAEDNNATVLLLEAGYNEYERGTWWSHIPGLVPRNQLGVIDWQYKSTKQKHACLGLNDQIAYYPRGKVLGGTSITNYMLYVRGSRDDFDHWATNLDADGWSYEDVLPYFKKFETINFKSPDSDLRGPSGPIQIREMPQTKFGLAYLEAIKEFGYKVLGDYNGKSSSGM